MYEDLADILSEISGTKVIMNELMNRHTTFRVGGPCSLFISPDKKHLPAVIVFCKKSALPYVVIGRGSNILVSDSGFEGLVIEIGDAFDKITTEGDMITAEAGASLASVARVAYENSLTGLEFASGIPGSAGGGLYMNAGAYGGEMKDVIYSAKALNFNGEEVEFVPEDMDLSYRHSAFMEQNLIITEMVFKLKAGNKDEIKATMDDYNGRRRDKQPLNYPSAGSFFKRPEGNFAGKLIEDAGLAGLRVGGAEVSTKHCGFVINVDNATSKDIINLMKKVQAEVNDKFGIMLEPEVRMLGKF
ncbi:MAG: UDP-N-acetylmuramate dehydrogenase [Lachnospiraceae bacterium]|nr:UDP-N-acetylmuramate dehydrogenase [Lachnospiraceae bacterium]